MKKILSLTLMALTLFVQHESHAMYQSLRQGAGRIGQQCQRLYTQGAQQVAPIYRSASTRLGQYASNIRPQASRWYSNMQSSARNLPTVRTTALGLGLGGSGLGAAYWQRPDIFGVARAEEEVPTPKAIIEDVTTRMTTTPAGLEGLAGPIGGPSKKEEKSPSDILDNLRAELNYQTINSSPVQHNLNEIRWQLRFFLNNHEANMDLSTRQKFTALVNDFLNMQNENLNKDLNDSIIDAGSTNKGIVNFLGDVIQHDILFANASYGTQSKISNIIIPDIYKKFFGDISNNSRLKAEFIKSINDMKKSTETVLKKELARQISPQDREELLIGMANLNRVLDAITKEVQGSPSFWSYFGY